MPNCITKLAAWLKLAQADVAATLAGEAIYTVGEDLGALIELGRLAQATPQDLRDAERLVVPVVRWDEEQGEYGGAEPIVRVHGPSPEAAEREATLVAVCEGWVVETGR